MKLSNNSTEGYIIDGQRVTWSDGMAYFPRYGVYIKVLHSDFTYGWANKMNYKLSVLKEKLS